MAEEYISRPALMAKLTSGDSQLVFRELTGAEAYTRFLALVNSAPGVMLDICLGVPNADTQEALQEVERMKATGSGKSYGNVPQMMEELLADE